MKITSLVENTSQTGMPVEHGLSLYIQLNDGKKVLFDMGQGQLFAQNAERLHLSIAEVDIAVISHGHYDHGGGLKTFLALNDHAPVYIHRDAFEPHYSLRETGLRYIGLDAELNRNPRLVFCGDQQQIDDSMRLFANVHGNCCNPVGNRLLFGPSRGENDNFCHEQNLVIDEDGKTLLLAGCAHNGIVNILRKATSLIGHTPTHVLAGMHLVKSGLNEAEEDLFIASLARELQNFPQSHFYTMHCTGLDQYAKLKALLGSQLSYLSCGDSINLS